MTTIAAKAILRSRNTAKSSKVLSTLLLRYPRWIHAEFMTHRAFSKNAASSRAIPVHKLIDSVMADPAVPMFWGVNQKGMQSGEESDATVNFPFDVHKKEYLENGIIYSQLVQEVVDLSPKDAWLSAASQAVDIARAFAEAGYHKQIINRLLEPFAHITVLCSATEWDNFLMLRNHTAAEPHMQVLARAIGQVLEDAPIQELTPGEWHMPFSTYRLWTNGPQLPGPDTLGYEKMQHSLACCASTSYKTVDDFDMSPERAKEICSKLWGPPLHASPFEHIAQADEFFDDPIGFANGRLHGNFVGFNQWRKMIQGENYDKAKAYQNPAS